MVKRWKYIQNLSVISSLREKPSERGVKRHDQKYLASAGEKDVGPFDT